MTERHFDEIDREAERVFGKTPETKQVRYRKAMERDLDIRWAEAIKWEEGERC